MKHKNSLVLTFIPVPFGPAGQGRRDHARTRGRTPYRLTSGQMPGRLNRIDGKPRGIVGQERSAAGLGADNRVVGAGLVQRSAPAGWHLCRSEIGRDTAPMATRA